MYADIHLWTSHWILIAISGRRKTFSRISLPAGWPIFGGREYRADFGSQRVSYTGDGFDIRFDRDDVPASVEGTATVEVDMRWFHIMDVIRASIYESGDVHWVNVG